MLANFFHNVRSTYSLMVAKQFHYFQKFSNKLSLYSRPQKLYALAVLVVVLFPDLLGLSVAIAFSALIMECLPIVHYSWRSLIGKAVILLTYAVIANFALANAASVVNQVTGVSSDFFTYSHNFAILLYIPAWVAAITIIGLVFFQIMSIAYVSAILLLKPFGIASKFNISKYPHPVITMVIRIALTLLIIVFLQNASETSQTKDLHVTETKDRSVMQSLAMKPHSTEATDKTKSSFPVTNDNLNSLETTVDTLNFDIDHYFTGVSIEDTEPSIQFLMKAIKVIQSENENDNKMIEKLVAHFIYYFDSDDQTRCQLEEGSRGVVLNDYEVLQITPDEQQQFGYNYHVRTCISPAFPESYYQQ